LALRQTEYGSLLPDYTALVFDEAHEIEDVATQYFGLQVSNYRVEELARDTEAALRQKGLRSPEVLAAVGELRRRANFIEAAGVCSNDCGHQGSGIVRCDRCLRIFCRRCMVIHRRQHLLHETARFG
jgi:Rad3-related DNA helicase